jgi:hypothetical protein
MSIDWIKRNVKVYGQDLDLKTAQKIPGLRAVFGETYTLFAWLLWNTTRHDRERHREPQVETGERVILWRNVRFPLYRSVLCLTRMTFVSHATRTGDIKDFVITEKSGIAKGIRRITAVTGHEAEEVSRVASSLKARLDQVEAMSGKEKEDGSKTFGVVCSLSFVLSTSSYTPTGGSQSEISVILKSNFTNASGSFGKRLTNRSRRRRRRSSKMYVCCLSCVLKFAVFLTTTSCRLWLNCAGVYSRTPRQNHTLRFWRQMATPR